MLKKKPRPLPLTAYHQSQTPNQFLSSLMGWGKEHKIIHRSATPKSYKGHLLLSCQRRYDVRHYEMHVAIEDKASQERKPGAFKGNRNISIEKEKENRKMGKWENLNCKEPRSYQSASTTCTGSWPSNPDFEDALHRGQHTARVGCVFGIRSRLPKMALPGNAGEWAMQRGDVGVQR